MNSLEYIEVSIRMDPFSEENAEIAMAEVSELPYESFVMEDPYLKCYVQKELYRASDLKAVLSGLPFAGGFRANLVPGENWNREWERSFEPIVVENAVTVKAPFNRDVARTRFNIRIHPGMAFGTGYHETTYMMIQSMLAHEDSIRGHVVLDMGCGTAILGILAAKMRAAHVYAIDVDAVAAQSAWYNAHKNRVGRHVETYCGDASLLQMGKYDVILANIGRNVLLQDLPTYFRSLRRGGLIVLSGFYAGDAPLLREAASSLGFRYLTALSRSGWACLQFLKNP